MGARSLARCALVVTIVAWALAARPVTGQSSPPADGIARLLAQFEQALLTGDPNRYLSLLTPEADRGEAATAAASVFGGPPVRAVVREQDRASIDPAKYRLVVDIFTDAGVQAHVATWRVDVRRSATDLDTWQIASQQVLTTLNGLYKLSLDRSKAYAARGVSIEAEDFHLQMTDGSAFVVDAAGRPTGLVLVGKGEVTFRPSPAAERGQMKIFAGADQLQTPVDAAFIRLNPNDMDEHVRGFGQPQGDPRDVKRAEDVFREHNARSFALDLGDLSPDAWSLLPYAGDVLVEMSTRRFGALTYARSRDEPEDIAFFDRKARRSIAGYASREHLTSRGPFYDEDAYAGYDIVDYDVDARFAPESGLIDARARMTLVVRAESVANLTVRLADALSVRSVTAEGMGRVLALRVRGRNSVIVSLPAVAVRGTRLTLLFDYSGPLTSQRPDAETVTVGAQQDPPDQDRERPIRIPDSYLYSNRAFWYPQSTVSDYATATLRLTVPARFSVVASGERVRTPSGDGEAQALEREGVRRVVFRATRPVRYLACVITPLVQAASERIRLDVSAEATSADPALAAPAPALDLTVHTNPGEKGRGRGLAALASDVMRFYAGLMGDCPYPSLDLALVERQLPGGHSPAYFAVINHVVPGSGLSWRGDPASIDNFPEYFVAHELAHQWWGQAVGWKNYHEQWLSEGFAQYFAALYAEHVRGPQLFQDILRRWQRWTVDNSDQGPVYLGYRVGHIRGDARVFRAVVYNKSATVLHMLRRLIGDEAFFGGLRRFYRDFRFRKAGTDDLQRALEAASRVSLQRFFDRWIYGDTLPHVRAVARTETAAGCQELVIRLEQAGEVFDVPVAVTLDYADRPPVEITVRLGEAQQEFRIPLAGPLRRLDLNRVDAVPFSDFVLTAPVPAGGPARPGPRAVRNR